MRRCLAVLLLLLTLTNPVTADGKRGVLARVLPLHRHPTLVRMMDQNNRWRAAASRPAQRLHPTLTKAAQDHANYMARTGAFSHESNGGPMGRARRYQFAGVVSENIAMGQVTISEAFQSWRNSSGHWANLCSDAPVAGFGYARDAGGTGYWVAMYGYPTSVDDAIEQDLRDADQISEEPSGEEVEVTQPSAPSPDPMSEEPSTQPAQSEPIP